MKRKVWNTATVPLGNRAKSTIPTMTLGRAGGIHFNTVADELLKLDQHKLNFIQDEERPADWYLEITKANEAFSVRTAKKDKMLQSIALVREICISCGLDPDCGYTLQIAKEASERNVYAILTKSARPTRKAKES